MTSRLLGYGGGLLMMASGAVHSLIGWPELQRSLRSAGTPAELALGLAVPWHFAGASMVGFGILILWLISRRERTAASNGTLGVIGSIYVLFAAWALLAVKADAFLLIFMVPGLMVWGALWRGSRERRPA